MKSAQWQQTVCRKQQITCQHLCSNDTQWNTTGTKT